MSESFEHEIQAKFAHLNDHELMSRMNRAPDFGYDDEEVELTRRAALMGLAWRWSEDFFRPKVELYKPEPKPEQSAWEKPVISATVEVPDGAVTDSPEDEK